MTTYAPPVTGAPITADTSDTSATDQPASQEELDYQFDLRGFRVLSGALTPDQVAAVNGWVDARNMDDLGPGDWVGDVEVHTYGAKDGVNFQNIIEGGPIFEELIDHPAWFDAVRRYIAVGAHQLRIDECFLNVRRNGGYIPVHSGGDNVRFSGLFRWHSGSWAVGQINILMALTDIGPGDGATTIIPSSHKSDLAHPQRNWRAGVGGDDATGMQEVHLRAGDALMFTDALCHGSQPRINAGERRVLIYRYAPHLLASRMNYIASEELLARLSPERRALVMPTPPRMRPGRVLRADAFPHDPVGG